jgi:hypothetical protein
MRVELIRYTHGSKFIRKRDGMKRKGGWGEILGLGISMSERR